MNNDAQSDNDDVDYDDVLPTYGGGNTTVTIDNSIKIVNRYFCRIISIMTSILLKWIIVELNFLTRDKILLVVSRALESLYFALHRLQLLKLETNWLRLQLWLLIISSPNFDSESNMYDKH